MSVKDQIRELEKQRDDIIEKAKSGALATIDAAVSELTELGFHYRVIEVDPTDGAANPGRTASRKVSTGRRSGIREDVLRAVTEKKAATRAELIAAMGAKDKSAVTSVSNALSALKKQGLIRLDGGAYTAA
jgi:hypothetical protein